MNRRPTLKQISETAGVSTFTVSRALSDGAGVSPETRERIRLISDELGYVPNQTARNLRASSSHFIGVLTTNSKNSFYAGIAASIQRHMLENGYSSFVSDAVEHGEYLIEREDKFISTMLQQRAAGIVLTHQPSAENLKRLQKFKMPLVFVDFRPAPEHASIPSILTDGYSAGYEAGKLFAQSQRKTWLLLAHSAGWSTRLDRERGFKDAADEAGAHLTVIEGGNDDAVSAKAMQDYLQHHELPNAVLCTNEPMLIGAMTALNARQAKIPDDISVISFDDFLWAQHLSPPITVIDQPQEELGAGAAKLMLDQIQQLESAGAMPKTAPSLEIKTRLIRRGSTL